MKNANAEQSTVGKIFLVSQVQTGRQFWQEFGVAGSVWRQLGIGVGQIGEKPIDRWPRNERWQAWRLVTAGDATADLVTRGRVEFVIQVKNRRND